MQPPPLLLLLLPPLVFALLPLLAASLASSATASTGSQTRATVVLLYSDEACAFAPAKISFHANESCSTTDAEAVKCSDKVPSYPKEPTYYYYTKTCTDDASAFAQSTFGADAFLLLNYYNASGCHNWNDTILYPLDGKCHATDVFGNSSAVATLADNGAVKVDWFTGSRCRGTASMSFSVGGDDVSSGACVKEMYRFVTYNTDRLGASSRSSSGAQEDESETEVEAPSHNESASNSSSDAESASNSSSDAESASNSSSDAESTSATTNIQAPSLSTGGIVGIVIASVLAIVAATFFRRRCRAHAPEGDANGKGGSVDSVVVLEEIAPSMRTMPGQYLYRSPIAGRSKATSQASSASTISTRRHHSTQGDLWDDETIIAARVPREKVVVGELISRGGYGEVYLGTFNARQVAVKMLLPERRKQIRHVSDFLAEIKLTAVLEHSCVVQFVGVAWDSLMDLCAMSEYMEGGDLRGLLASFEASHQPQGFDFTKVKIAKQVAHALTYLHSLQPMVLHRDLKSRNVLLDGELNAKLTDFGVSRERVDATMTAGVGTSLWMAPEVMMGQQYDDKADVFSFGVLLAEIDSHVAPYSTALNPSNGRKLPDTAILQRVASGSLQVEFSRECLPDMSELGRACTALDPRERPSASLALYKLHLAFRAFEQQHASL